MEDVTVDKQSLLATLKENREAHHKIFLEAVEGYKKQAEQMLEDELGKIRSGKFIPIVVSLPLPVDHTRDYDRIIRMVEMDQSGATIVLNELDFSQYVMDEWQWKRQFLTANAAYSVTAKSQT